MSTRAPAWWEQKYVAGVTYQLQSEGWLLKPYFNSAGKIDGKTVSWRIAGRGMATQRSDIVEDRPVMNADRTLINGTMIPYEANDWINTTDVVTMTVDEQAVVQKTAAMAIGRKFDAVMMATMDAAGSNIPTIGNGSAAIDITAPMRALSQIRAQGAGKDFCCALPFAMMDQLELYKQFSNSQYVGDDFPLAKALGARVWHGCTFLPIPDEFFASPVAGSFDAYLWEKTAVGLAWANEMATKIGYVDTKKAWFAGNDVMFGSSVLLPTAIRRLRFASDATVPVSIPTSS